jgi:hypothetical protein
MENNSNMNIHKVAAEAARLSKGLHIEECRNSEYVAIWESGEVSMPDNGTKAIGNADGREYPFVTIHTPTTRAHVVELLTSARKEKEKKMGYEIRLTCVPNGCYDEQYLGTVNRQAKTLKKARLIVRQFRAAAKARPEDFEPGMTPRILRLVDGAEVR